MPAPESPSTMFSQAIADHLAVIERLRDQQPVLEAIAYRMAQALSAGNKILLFGNGGSAADAQHLAAELVGRFRRERPGLPALAPAPHSSRPPANGHAQGHG